VDAVQKHLELIQNVISRMATCSFLLKGWAITLVSAMFVLAEKTSHPEVFILAYFPTVMLWILDGYFLSQERQYRGLFDKVRLQNTTDFSMNASSFSNSKTNWLAGILSKTLLIFYLTLCASILLVIIKFL
jgi:hypothetical protein